jgi:hypothetical protein
MAIEWMQRRSGPLLKVSGSNPDITHFKPFEKKMGRDRELRRPEPGPRVCLFSPSAAIQIPGTVTA